MNIMYKVIIDTNILINATQDNFSYAWKIIDLVIQGKVRAVASDKILKENRLIVERNIINEKDKNKLEDFFVRVEVVGIKKRLKIIKDDPEDDKFIECADQTKADFIISSDSHLLNLEKYPLSSQTRKGLQRVTKNTKIVNPKNFWYLYSGEKEDEWKEFFRSVFKNS